MPMRFWLVGDLLEAVLPVWGQGQCYVDRVYYPPQENLAGQPHTVACYKLLQQQDLLTVIPFSGVTGPEHLFQ